MTCCQPKSRDSHADTNAVHQVAQDTAPGSRVVYVDNDDVAVAHSRLLLDGNPDAAVPPAGRQPRGGGSPGGWHARLA